MLKRLLLRFWSNKTNILELGTVVAIVLTLCANIGIENSCSGKTYTSVEAIPKNDVGLVLGTSRTLQSGNLNWYFEYRIRATVELYTAGKIKYVLISGDNSRSDYDEPSDFKQELVKRGIPENRIYLDYAGFRTLDSMVRAQAVFGLSRFTVISQEFHNKRAIYLADKHGISVIGYNAKDIRLRSGIKVKIREQFARTKAFIDILLGVEPKFYGERVRIG